MSDSTVLGATWSMMMQMHTVRIDFSCLCRAAIGDILVCVRVLCGRNNGHAIMHSHNNNLVY